MDPISFDPLEFKDKFWPDVHFYDKQIETIYSVMHDDETFVPAGNMLGKDFVAGFIALWFFMIPDEVRVMTTSVKDEHLAVLWGEMDRYIRTAKYPLRVEDGGYLVYNHRSITKMVKDKRDGTKKVDKYSYLKGQVSKKGEGLSGHHAKRTLLVIDEASGVDEIVYTMASAWFKRALILGNPHPCTNFFYHGVKAGNLKAKNNGHYYRKVIKIKAEDSPNVIYAMGQKRLGREITNEEIVPGVLTFQEYEKRRETWDAYRQCVGLDGEFPETAGELLFPPAWLNHSEQLARELEGQARKAKTIGEDTAEGGDNTVSCAVDYLGLIDLLSKKTPDTSVITGDTIAYMRKHGVKAKNVLFDAGGGGKQHADRLRSKGYAVRAIYFGGGATPEKRRGLATLGQRKEQDETREVYKNRRAEMYGLLSLRMDLDGEFGGFAIPSRYTELRRQLAPIPRLYDGEGRLYLPPKNKPSANSTVETMQDLIGCSPDEADSLVLAVFGLQERRVMLKAGVAF